MEPGYPAARRSDVTDILNGVRVPDPYRWLEDAGSQETGEWLGGQDALYAAYRDGRAAGGGGGEGGRGGPPRRGGVPPAGSSCAAGRARSTPCCSPPTATGRSRS